MATMHMSIRITETASEGPRTSDAHSAPQAEIKARQGVRYNTLEGLEDRGIPCSTAPC